MSRDGTRIRLLVVDDHTLFRRGLIALLADDPRFEVVGEAGDAGQAQRLAQALQPDVVLLDNHLPGVSGVAALPGLHDAAPQAQVLMLTVSEDGDDLAAALRGGARGYLLKTADQDVLALAIVRAARGESTVSADMTDQLVAAARAAATPPATTPAPQAPPGGPLGALSPREREILACIARGASNKHIARELDIAETTVKIHVQHILRKLGLSSRVQAAVLATGQGLG